MADYEDQQQHREGVIHSHVELAEAAANGSRTMASSTMSTERFFLLRRLIDALLGCCSQVEFLLENGAHIDAPGRDGTTPLCAAALWGNDAMVGFLLERGADIGARNEGTEWTALHAAAFQEHGKTVRVLLDRGADPKAADAEARTPIDYASISEAIWPFFAARGCRRSQKSELIAKGIIRKIVDQPEHTASSDKNSESISSFSRPGSSYTRAQTQLPVARRQGTAKSRDGRVLTGPIDPLGDAPGALQRPSNQRRPSLQGLGL